MSEYQTIDQYNESLNHKINQKNDVLSELNKFKASIEYKYYSRCFPYFVKEINEYVIANTEYSEYMIKILDEFDVHIDILIGKIKSIKM